MDSATQFRRLTEDANLNRDNRGRRYSKSARELAIRYYRRQQAAGESLSEISKRLGINGTTLKRWLDAETNNNRRIPMRPVAVVEPGNPGESPSIQLTLSNGLRIEGLKRADVIELVKALA